MKRSYLKKLPITVQLSLLGLLIVMVMISIMAVNYYRAVNVVKKNNSDYIKGVISQLNQSISSNSNDIKRIMETIAYNGQTVQNFLSETNPAQKFEMFNQLKAYLSDMRKMKKAILDIAPGRNNGAVFNLLANSVQIEAISREIPRDNLSYILGLKMIDLPYTSTPILVAGAHLFNN